MRIAIPLSKLRVAPDGSHATLHSPANAHPLKVVTGKRNPLILDFGDAQPADGTKDETGFGLPPFEDHRSGYHFAIVSRHQPATPKVATHPPLRTMKTICLIPGEQCANWKPCTLIWRGQRFDSIALFDAEKPEGREKGIGGSDGTRNRGLMRDRQAF